MSSDEADLLFPAFKVEDNGEEIDFSIPPLSGQDYLRRVRREAAQCPDVVIVPVEHRPRPLASTPLSHCSSSNIHPAPAELCPSVEWQQHQCAIFSQVRSRLAAAKARYRKSKPPSPAQKLPDKEDSDGWCHLCFGQYSPESQDSDDSSKQEGALPLLSLILRLDQPTIINVLEFHNNWLEVTGFSRQQGRWFYALMCSLEKPLEPEACSLLRTFAKNCATLRATLESSTDPYLAPLNLIICLVARYFGQMDLVDVPS